MSQSIEIVMWKDIALFSHVVHGNHCYQDNKQEKLYNLCTVCKFFSVQVFFNLRSNSATTHAAAVSCIVAVNYLFSQTRDPEASVLFSISCACANAFFIPGMLELSVDCPVRMGYNGSLCLKGPVLKDLKAIIVVQCNHPSPLCSLSSGCLHELYGCLTKGQDSFLDTFFLFFWLSFEGL